MQHVPRLTQTLPFIAALLAPATTVASPSQTNDLLAMRAGDDNVSTEDTKETTDESVTADAVTEDANTETTEAEALPFETVSLAELEAAANAPREDRVVYDTEPRMNPAGVEDPFPDRLDRTRPRDVAVPGMVALGLAGASIVMGRLALRPDCGSQDDITTCTAPSEGDIGVRGGRVFGAIGFGAGGAIFGAVAGRQFGHWLDEHPRLSFERKRRIAVGTGATAVVLGTAGMIAGATMLGVGTRRAVGIGREFDGVDTNALTDAEHLRLNEGLDEVRTARAGLMVLVSTPTLFATGVSLLVHRPRMERLSISPALSSSYAGVNVRVRF